MMVCIDAGHGGKDPGAVLGNVKEKDVNIKIAHIAGDLLENYVSVLFTRIMDEDISLEKRVYIANQKKVSLFVSIHCNSAVSSEAKGLEVYCYLKSPLTWGYKLANRVMNNVLKYAEATGYEYLNRGVKANPDLYVIRKTVMPAVLIEAGFVSNPDERAWLCSSQGQISIGSAIAVSILQILKQMKAI